MVEVICDTSFIIQLATKRIKNIDNLNVEIGNITFVVPQVVKNELEQLINDPKKTQNIHLAIHYIKKFKIIPINGTSADKEIINYIKKHKSIIATLDRDLKKQIKSLGSSVMSLTNDRIILES